MTKILGIDPGTREMGVALLEGSELRYYAVKTITRHSSPGDILAQTHQIVSRLVSVYKPGILAIEKPFLGYGNRSSVLVVAGREIVELGKKLGCKIMQISPQTAKKLVAGDGKATKRQVAGVVCGKYPELKAYLNQNSRLAEKYWANMFDAVAVAVAGQSLIKQKPSAD